MATAIRMPSWARPTAYLSHRHTAAQAVSVELPPVHVGPATTPGTLSLVRRARTWVRDHTFTDVHCVVLLASALSIGFYVWYARQGLTLAYGDAISHLMIARRVLFSRTPGLAQLGTVWLPLHHILMLPLVWISPLYYSGFAGALPSMVSFVVGSVYLFRTSRLLFGSRLASWIAALVFMLNPNVLYMQSTPMSELPLLVAAIAVVYYLVSWATTDSALELVKAAGAVAAGTLIRYDGWALALGAAVLVGYVGWRRRGVRGAEARLLLFAMLAFVGCAAWFLYNAIVFHDPLAFFHGAYSSLGQQKHLRAAVGQLTHRNLGLSTAVYTQATIDTVGWVLFAAALIGFLGFTRRFWRNIAAWPVYLTLLPFAFNIASLYAGTSSLFTNEFKALGLGGYYNERYGMMMLPAIALFLAAWTTLPLGAMRRPLLAVCLALVVLFSGVNPTLGTPYVLKDPLDSGGEVTGIQAGQWLGAHYHGGFVLFSYVPDVAPMFYSKIPDDDFITDSNGAEFKQALAEPQSVVTWIVLTQTTLADPSPIWLALNGRQDWHQYFILRATFGSTQIYERVTPQQQASAPRDPAPSRQNYLVPITHSDSSATYLSSVFASFKGPIA